MFDVEVHIDRTGGFAMQQERMVLSRGRGGFSVSVWRFDTARWETVDEGVEWPEGAILTLPRGTWDALVQLAAPHADAGALDVLREALAVERERVDRVIPRLS